MGSESETLYPNPKSMVHINETMLSLLNQIYGKNQNGRIRDDCHDSFDAR